MFPATGKMIKWSDTDIMDFDANGKMSAHWANNPNEPLYQLGFGAFLNPNTAIVMDIYEKFKKRDVSGITAVIADEFQLDVKDHPILSKSDIFQGKSGLASWLVEYAAIAQNTKLEPQGFFAEGDDVVVPLTVEYKLLASGKMYTTTLIQRWRFKDGKATWLQAIGGKPMEMKMTAKN